MDSKKNITRFLILLIACVLIIQACCTDTTKDDTHIQPEQEEATINAEFKPFLDRFIDEMHQRGLDFSNNRLSVVFVDNITMPDSDRFCAYGYRDFQNSGTQRVEVINNEYCWARRSETEKENLMFHELGHALLGYGHINGSLPNGSQKSLMCASETCNNYRVYNSYQDEQRSFYLDQLVDKELAAPDWASAKIFSKILAEDSFDSNPEDWTTEIGEDPNNEASYDFFLENEQLVTPPNALAIKSTSGSSANTFGHWQKTFTISDFESCSNILIRTHIVTEDLIEGSVGIAIDLLEVNSANELEFFARYSNAMRDNGAGIVSTENFVAQVICIPKETAAIQVKLYMNGVAENTIATFDNLEIELYE